MTLIGEKRTVESDEAKKQGECGVTGRKVDTVWVQARASLSSWDHQPRPQS